MYTYAVYVDTCIYLYIRLYMHMYIHAYVYICIYISEEEKSYLAICLCIDV